MINLIKQALFIQPLPNHLAKDYGSFSGAQPHLIFKRSLGDVIGRGCDISGRIHTDNAYGETNNIKLPNRQKL